MASLTIGGTSGFKSVIIRSNHFIVKAYYGRDGGICCDAEENKAFCKIKWISILECLLPPVFIVSVCLFLRIKNPIALALCVFGFTFLLDEITSRGRNHGAEHKVISAFGKKTPLILEDVQKESRFSSACGSNFFPGILAYMFMLQINPGHMMLISIIIAVIITVLGLIISGNFPNFSFQQLTTREPTNRELNLAIEAMQAIIILEKIEIE